VSDRLDNIANGNDDDDKYRIDKYDDEYYLSIGEDPPRFTYYRQARAERWKALQEQGHHKPSDTDPGVTQEEIDFGLKRALRVPPEQRYQHEKEHYYFHELYVEGGKECNPVYEGCTPKCRF
jgi:hypothetical protein